MSANTFQVIPFITDARLVALAGPRGGIVITFASDDGTARRTVARSVSTIEDVERFAHDLLALAQAARGFARDAGAKPGHAPRLDTRLMSSLRVDPPIRPAPPRHLIAGQGAIFTLREGPRA